MKSMFIPSPELVGGFRSAAVTITDMTDSAVVVRLVEDSFAPEDPSTWPAPSAHFASKTSGTPPTLEYDAVSELWYVVWPDPEDGWDYVSATITDPITVTGFTVKNAAGDNIGAATIPPVAVSENGQHIVLPFISLAIGDLWVPADIPVTV